MQNYLVLCCSNTTYVLMAIFQANLDHSTFRFLFLPLHVFEDNLWSLAVHFSWYDWLPLPVCPCEVFTHWNPPPMSPNRHIKLSVSSWSVLSRCHYMNCSTSVVVVIVVVVVAAAGVVCLCVWLCQWVPGLSWVVATTWSVLLQCSQRSPTPHLCNTAVCHTQRPDEALQLLEGVKLYEIYVSV